MLVNIKPSSSTHLVLKYLKMKKDCLVTSKDIYNFSPIKFQRPSKVDRSLSILVRMGFAIQLQNCYTITQSGVQALYEIVKQQPIKENL
jgi:hypothetical protein